MKLPGPRSAPASAPEEGRASAKLRWDAPLGLAAVAAALFGFALAITWSRIHRGVDFMDESVCVAIPYRFALGDRPYLDEVNTIQSAGLPLRPLVAAHLALEGGTDGLVLFLRHGWLALFALAAAAGAWCLRPLTGLALAFATAAIAVAWLPHGMPVLNYNSLACAWFAVGLALGSAPFFAARSESAFALAGASHALCALAIHSWAAPCALAWFLWWRASPPERRTQRLGLLAGGGALALAPFAPDLLNFGPDALEFARLYAERGGSLAERFVRTVEILWAALPRAPLTLAAAAGALACAWRGLPLTALFLVLALCSLLAPDLQHRSSLMHLCFAGMLAPLLLPGAGERARLAFRLLWWPSAAAALVAALTSSNAGINAGFGMLGGVLALAVLLAAQARRAARPELALAVAFAALASLAGWMLAHQRYPHNDDPLPMLDARCESGPFRGLWTSRAKRDWFDAFRADLAEFERPDRRLLAFYRFPAAYLVSRMPPAARTMYTPEAPGVLERDATVKYERALAEAGGGEVVLVRVRRNLFGLTREKHAPRGAVDEWVESHATLERAAADWDVFLLPGRR